MLKKYIAVLLLFACIFSCKTDFNTVAPYKEITVVYGLLDPAKGAQYIKINKAFLGEGNALVMAQQMDSTNYPPGTLDVKLQQIQSGQEIQFVAVLDSTKEPGIFSNPYQIIYRNA